LVILKTSEASIAATAAQARVDINTMIATGQAKKNPAINAGFSSSRKGYVVIA
jgi:hypothetical protein